MTTTPRWRLAPDCALELTPLPLLMAIINTTPDSFSDGGQFMDPADAVEHGLRAVQEGASILDVGGESTRPGAAAVDAHEQQRRVTPVIAALRRACEVPISVDTTLASVAEAALDAGATIVNDTSAGLDDPRMLPLIAERGCGVVLMHRRKAPAQEIRSDRIRVSASAPGAGDVVERVARELAARVDAACDAGVMPEQIVVDPGLGFGKSIEENFALLARVLELEARGRPVLIGASRKSFIGHASGVERAENRLAGSLAAGILAAERGAAVLRIHDVGAHREALAVRATISTHFRESGDSPWLAPRH